MVNNHWLVVTGTMEFDDFPETVGNGMSSSQLTIHPSFFRGVGQPPTSCILSFCQVSTMAGCSETCLLRHAPILAPTSSHFGASWREDPQETSLFSVKQFASSRCSSKRSIDKFRRLISPFLRWSYCAKLDFVFSMMLHPAGDDIFRSYIWWNLLSEVATFYRLILKPSSNRQGMEKHPLIVVKPRDVTSLEGNRHDLFRRRWSFGMNPLSLLLRLRSFIDHLVSEIFALINSPDPCGDLQGDVFDNNKICC